MKLRDARDGMAVRDRLLNRFGRIIRVGTRLLQCEFDGVVSHHDPRHIEPASRSFLFGSGSLDLAPNRNEP